MKNAASYDVAKSIDAFAWLNRIMHDAIREEKHTKQLSHLFGCTIESIVSVKTTPSVISRSELS